MPCHGWGRQGKLGLEWTSHEGNRYFQREKYKDVMGNAVGVADLN